ncbi:molybdenum cofactor guanylyltransferase MobA [Orrella sp. JC864]|uniref:molybdenum cofactor guanylyltransferase MobA n=1 Tax=Orrella sp. JC864 TaxID=3120298 RepID=UPI00300974B2
MASPAGIPRTRITGLVLAGGQGRRMGGADKGLLDWNGQPLVAGICAALAPQVGAILISANRNAQAYARHGRVVPDDPALGAFQGPLAGLAAGLAQAGTAWVLSWPCDMPHVPPDLAARLGEAALRQGAPLAVAQAQGRVQPVCMLASVALLPGLLAYLRGGGRRVQAWQQAAGAAIACFDAPAGAACPAGRGAGGGTPASFANLNTPEELQAARALQRSQCFRS